MEAKLTPEERLRLQVQISKARRLNADEDWRRREAERRAELEAGARYVAMFTNREGDQYVSRYGGQPIWDRDRAVVHADRQCQSIRQMKNANVRLATPEEFRTWVAVCTGAAGSRVVRSSTSQDVWLSRRRRAPRCGRCPAARSRPIAGGTRGQMGQRCCSLSQLSAAGSRLRP